MPSSRWSSARKIITVLSIAALCALSFTAMVVAIVHPQALDSTQAGDFGFFPKRYTPHGRRTFRFARAPQATTPVSNPGPNANPAPSQDPTPTQAPAAASPATSNPPAAPPPSPRTSPAPAVQSPTPSRAPSSAPAQAAPATSSNPAATPAAASQSPTSPVAPAPSSGVVASSPQGATSSSTGRIVTNLSDYPATTFVYTGQPQSQTSTPTSSSTAKIIGPTQTISASPNDGSTTTPTGFFQNKSAVGVTFGIVGGVCVLLIVLGARFYSRRFRRRQRDEDDFFEKFPIPDNDGDDFARHSAAFGAGTPGGGSIVDINGTSASAGVYPDRPAYYGNPTPGPVYNTGLHGLAAPSGFRNSIGSANSLPHPAPTPGHPFADPANASNSSVSRPLPARMQEIVATDSYYGSDAAGVDTNSMGYAK
jgi:hypothetical protein